ncbi:hypothetical protein ACUXZZ_25665 [Streptomyces graminifolii]|uniref:hypothetical protein n=1 Tax=Streptomyces graminifolii TaxID=1266771 RepID=UPI004058DAA9
MVGTRWALAESVQPGPRAIGRYRPFILYVPATSWNAGISSVDVIYRDENEERHYVTMAAEDLGLTGDESVVRVVYDPLKPDRATTAEVLKKPAWKTQEGNLVIIGLCTGAVVTALIAVAGV